jgi:hypothetical protein
VQCEILEQQILGGGPANEEQVPEVNENGHPSIFDFFGIDQPGQGPFMDPIPEHQDNDPDNQAEWGPWLQ